MCDQIRTWLEKHRTIHSAATDGPWEAGDRWVYTMPIYDDDRRLSNVCGMSFADPLRNQEEAKRGQRNVRAIVDAHNIAVPRALNALDAVLGVLSAGVRDGDDAETIRNVALHEIAEALEGMIDGGE